jgi:small basic protein (TIGR04137 family)
MSLHRSLKTKPIGLNQHRNVLTRHERIAKLTELGIFEEGDSPLGIVKVASRKIVTKKKQKEEDEGTVEIDAPIET